MFWNELTLSLVFSNLLDPEARLQNVLFQSFATCCFLVFWWIKCLFIRAFSSETVWNLVLIRWFASLNLHIEITRHKCIWIGSAWYETIHWYCYQIVPHLLKLAVLLWPYCVESSFIYTLWKHVPICSIVRMHRIKGFGSSDFRLHVGWRSKFFFISLLFDILSHFIIIECLLRLTTDPLLISPNSDIVCRPFRGVYGFSTSWF